MVIEFLMLGVLLGFVIFFAVGYAIDRSHMARDIKEIKIILSGKEKDDQTSEQG